MNDKQNIQKIIASLSEEIEMKNASFAILHTHGSIESFIEATEDGLKLYALELLKCSSEVNTVIDSPSESIIAFPNEDDWIHEKSQTIVQYIRPIKHKSDLAVKERQQETFRSKLFSLGCLSILLLLLVACFVGLWAIVKWLF